MEVHIVIESGLDYDTVVAGFKNKEDAKEFVKKQIDPFMECSYRIKSYKTQ